MIHPLSYPRICRICKYNLFVLLIVVVHFFQLTSSFSTDRAAKTSKCFDRAKLKMIRPSPSQQIDDAIGINGNKPQHSNQLLNSINLVAGTTVGAGILALPSVASTTGFIPSTIALVGSWLFMVTTGLLIAEVNYNLVKEDKKSTDRHTTEMDSVGILSMTKKTLGSSISTLAGIIYVFLHYALLVAYIAEAGAVASNFFQIPKWVGPIGFTSIVGGMLTFGSDTLVAAINNFFVLIVVVTFFGLIGLGIPSIDYNNLLYSDFRMFLKTIPITFVALVYHNVVPVICKQLEYNVKSIQVAIAVGSLIPLIMFIAWDLVILGIGTSSTKSATGSTATTGIDIDPLELLQQGSSGELTGALISLFSEAAIITSFIGFVFGLVSFFSDVFPKRQQQAEADNWGNDKKLLYAITLFPPLIVSLVNPNIFQQSLDYAGTFGISILFGAIPALMALELRHSSSQGKIARNNNESIQSTLYEEIAPGGRIGLYTILFLAAVVIAQNLVSLVSVQF